MGFGIYAAVIAIVHNGYNWMQINSHIPHATQDTTIQKMCCHWDFTAIPPSSSQKVM